MSDFKIFLAAICILLGFFTGLLLVFGVGAAVAIWFGY
jgi:hypothetical protein